MKTTEQVRAQFEALYIDKFPNGSRTRMIGEDGYASMHADFAWVMWEACMRQNYGALDAKDAEIARLREALVTVDAIVSEPDEPVFYRNILDRTYTVITAALNKANRIAGDV